MKLKLTAYLISLTLISGFSAVQSVQASDLATTDELPPQTESTLIVDRTARTPKRVFVYPSITFEELQCVETGKVFTTRPSVEHCGESQGYWSPGVSYGYYYGGFRGGYRGGGFYGAPMAIWNPPRALSCPHYEDGCVREDYVRVEKTKEVLIKFRKNTALSKNETEKFLLKARATRKGSEAFEVELSPVDVREQYDTLYRRDFFTGRKKIVVRRAQ